MSEQLGYCLAPFLAIAICIALPIGIWTFLDLLSTRDPKDYAINTLFGSFDKKK